MRRSVVSTPQYCAPIATMSEGKPYTVPPAVCSGPTADWPVVALNLTSMSSVAPLPSAVHQPSAVPLITAPDSCASPGNDTLKSVPASALT